MKIFPITCYPKHSPPAPPHIWRLPSRCPSTGDPSSASNPERFVLALNASSLDGGFDTLRVMGLAGILKDYGSVLPSPFVLGDGIRVNPSE